MCPLLVSVRLRYVPLSLKHLSNSYVSWLNDPLIYKYLESGGDYTMDKLRDYLEEVEKKMFYFGQYI